MSEHVILFAGPVGSGKTTAIKALSETAVVRTERPDRERSTVDEPTTTVALDYGEIFLDDQDRVRLYGIPSQKRFEFTWRSLAERAQGLVLLVNNDGIEPIGAMLTFLEDFADIVRRGGVVICVTRTDLAGGPSVGQYQAALDVAHPGFPLPVVEADPRDRGHMRLALLSLLANLERRRTLGAAGATA